MLSGELAVRAINLDAFLPNEFGDHKVPDKVVAYDEDCFEPAL